MLNELISVCCKKNAPVWEVASHYIVKNIAAHNYNLIVPDDEVDLFIKITPKSINVISESVYVPGLKDTILSYMPLDQQERAGWYLQQFIKICAAKTSEGVSLIWDADTIPLKKLDFIGENGNLIYYKSDEFHEAYFDLIEKITGLKKSVDFSFIAQCFVYQPEWIRDFCDEIETTFGKNWMQAIIQNINFDEFSGFSEYETLGTYFHNKHSSKMTFINNGWYRFGNSLIGGIEKIDNNCLSLLSKKYDYVSFEDWDVGCCN